MFPNIKINGLNHYEISLTKLDKTINLMLAQSGLRSIPWDRYYGGFDTLFAASAPIFWLFFLSTGVAYFVLRMMDSDRHRPFKAPWFPLCPLLFCGMSAFGLYSATNYAAPLLPLIAIPFFAGVPLYFVSNWMGNRPRQVSQA